MDIQAETPVLARSRDWLDVPLARLVTLDRATLLLGLILLLTVVTRFWDLGARALHHDESLHAVYSYYLYDRGLYQHEPLMHGPVLFHLTALGYWLFGASDATARLVPALLGVLLAWIPWKFRGWLGTRGALAASAMVLISPSLLYYSRFIREDIFAITWTAIIAYGLWKYVEGGEPFHLYTMVAGWALLFSQKELSFLIAFLFWTFLALVLAVRVVRGLKPRDARHTREWHLLVAMGALFLPLATPVLLFAFNLHPGAIGAETSIYNFASTWPASFYVRAVAIVLGLAAVGGLLAARLWDGRRFLVAAAIFWGIFVLFHTTFLTNGFGVASGIIGALGYWIEQQEVARGEQPWFYYALLVPLYEFLPLGIGFAGLAALPGWLRRRAAPEASDEQPVPPPDAVPQLDARRLWPLFNVWWFGGAFLMLSVASEKMPWLLVHLAFPLILFAGWTLGRFLDGADWQALRSRRALGFTALFLLALFALVSLLWMLLTRQLPFRGMDEVNLQITLRWVVTMLVLAGAGWAALSASEGLGGRGARQVATLALLALLGVATVRFALIASFRNADTPHEPLIFVQSSPSVTMVAEDIAAISERVAGGKNLRVAYDNFTSWPFDWYLRDYPNRFFYGDAPQSYADAVRNAEVVLVGWSNEEKLKPLVSGYVRHEYPLRWWFPEDYKDLTQQYVLEPDPNNPGQLLPRATGQPDESPLNVLRNLRLFAQNPTYRDDFWDFLRDRRVKQPLGGENFIVYLKPEIAAQVWQHGDGIAVAAPDGQETTAPAPAAPAVDLSAATVALPASQIIGADGSLLTPRDVAVLPDGTLAVADTGNHRIRLLEPDGTLVREFGSFGAEPGQFNEPWGIAAAPDGTLYVADTWNHRVQHLDTAGRVLHVWGAFADTAGQLGQPATFWGPRDVAVDEEGRVYVTDTGNKRVEVFEADGTFVSQFGGVGSAPGQLAEPVGIAVAPDGTLWVADTWNQRVQHFSAEGAPLEQFPVGVWGGQNVLNKPYVTAGEDRVWLSDPEGYRLLELDTAGELQRVWGQFGTDASGVNVPLGLAWDGATLWVADSENHRLLGFDTGAGEE